MLFSLIAITALCGIIAFGFYLINEAANIDRLSSACSILFYAYINDIKKAYDTLAARILFVVYILAAYRFFGSSNHFLISLDIIFFFSMILIIIFQNLKIAQTRPCN